jgi:hypothetical protein
VHARLTLDECMGRAQIQHDVAWQRGIVEHALHVGARTPGASNRIHRQV